MVKLTARQLLDANEACLIVSVVHEIRAMALSHGIEPSVIRDTTAEELVAILGDQSWTLDEWTGRLSPVQALDFYCIVVPFERRLADFQSILDWMLENPPTRWDGLVAWHMVSHSGGFSIEAWQLAHKTAIACIRAAPLSVGGVMTITPHERRASQAQIDLLQMIVDLAETHTTNGVGR